MICSRSAEDAAKLNSTVVPGLAASKAAPTSANASVSDAAANTVMSPSSVDAGAVVVVEAEPPSSLPQAARTSSGRADRAQELHRTERHGSSR